MFTFLCIQEAVTAPEHSDEKSSGCAVSENPLNKLI